MINEVIITIKKTSNLHQILARKDFITDADIDVLHDSIEQLDDNLSNVNLTNFRIRQKENSLFQEFFKDIENNGNIHHVNILNRNKIHFPTTWKKPNILYLKDQRISSHKVLRRNIGYFNTELAEMTDIPRYITSLVISLVSKNESIYLKMQTGIAYYERNKCLICLKAGNSRVYASFGRCSHKICVSCIDRFMIMHGSCPFDNAQISYLKITDGSTDHNFEDSEYVQQYLQRNYQDFASEMFREINIFSDNRQQIVDQNEYISEFMKTLTRLHQYRNGERYMEATEENLILNMKHSLEDVMNHSLIRLPHAGFAKYDCFISCFKMFLTNFATHSSFMEACQGIPNNLMRRLNISLNDYDLFITLLQHLEHQLLDVDTTSIVELHDDIVMLNFYYGEISILEPNSDPNCRMISAKLYLANKI